MKCDVCGNEAVWKSTQHKVHHHAYELGSDFCSDETERVKKPVLEKSEQNLCSACVQDTYRFTIDESPSPYRCDQCRKPLGKKVYRMRQSDGSCRGTLVPKTGELRDYLFCSESCIYAFCQCEKLK